MRQLYSRKQPRKRNLRNIYVEQAFFEEIRNAIAEGIQEAITSHPTWIIPKAAGSLHKRIWNNVYDKIVKRKQ